MALLLSTGGYSAIYYVSNTGNDSNAGTSETLAWKSLAKVNSTIFSPGDKILFKRGDVWEGTIIVNAAGTTSNPITYGAYGIGEKPKILGAGAISGWTLHSGNIYKASFSKKINQLFINDQRMQVARYPNTGYFNITSVISTTHFVSTEISSGINYAGAKVHIKTNNWRIDTRDVTASGGQGIYIDSNTGTGSYYGLQTGQDFFLCNKLEFLDKAGQWYYSAATQTVYLWTPTGSSPANYVVRGSYLNNGFEINGNDNIVIQGLNISEFNDNGILISASNNIVIDDNDIYNIEGIGIKAIGDNNTITNNIIDGCNHISIQAAVNNSTISDNHMFNTALYDNLGLNGINGYSYALSLGGNANNVTYNRIINSLFSGISWTGQNCNIDYNYIDNVCLTLTDGGCIYTFSSNINDPIVAGSKIRYNILKNSKGVASIYLDERTRDVLIEHNTITQNKSHGIFCHDNMNIEAGYNTIYDNGKGIRSVGPYTNNNFHHNIIAVNKDTRDGLYNPTLALRDPTENSFTLNYNTYVDHHFPYPFRNLDTYGFHTFSSWKSTMNQDWNSTFDGSALASGESEQLFYNDSKTVKTISLGSVIYRDLNGAPISGSITLQPFTSKLLIRTTLSSSANQSPVIQSQTFSIGDKLTNDFIGNVIAYDPDAGQLLSYEITGGNEAALFYIDQSTGDLYANKTIQASWNTSVSLIVRVTDNAITPLSSSATINVIISQGTSSDVTAPTVASFTIPPSSASLNVAISSFSATDNKAVTAYMITESPSVPSPTDNRWVATPPTSYSFTSEGTKTLYAWAKDEAGNVSSPLSDQVTITLPVSNSPESEYLFEETAGTTVIDSKGDNNGTIVNEEFRVSGHFGNGLEFFGNGYIDLGQSFGSNVQNQVTLSAWIKPSTSASGYQAIIRHGGPNVNTFTLYINRDLGLIGFKTTGTSPSWSQWIDVKNINQLWDGNWHQITATYNGEQKIIYFDATPVTTVASTGNIESGAGYNLYLAAAKENGTIKDNYIGVLDEVRIYNYALSASEVSQLFNLVITPPDVTAPTVASFTIPPTSASLNVAISSFSATDNKAVTAYMITESPSVPSPTDNRWVATPPTSYSFTSEGTKTLYAWAKDEAGNVSSPLSDHVTITLPVSNSPESEYLFEETAGVTVIDSKGDNNGTIVNEEFRVSGHFGNGLEFFGNGYIDLGQSFGSNVQNQVTLSAWIKPSPSASGYQAIIRHGGPNVNTFTLYINRDLGLIGFKTTGTSPSWSQWIDVKNINQLWDGNWHQITATYNGEQKIIYFDATPVTTVASTGNIESGAGYNLYLAAAKENGTIKDNYIGVLDEVRIYNYALSASEVSQLFNLVITPPDVTAPTVTSFTIPPTSASLNVAISSFSATDNKAVTAYMITESPSVPSPTDNRWVATPPTSYSFTSEGTKTLYAWAKDEAGNVSSPLSDQVTITLPVSNSPESEYLFEETAGVTVIDSKGDNNGTIVNEEFRVSGHFGNGLEFFGNGYIDLGQSFGSNVQNQVTLSAWIKPSTSASGYQAIIRHGGPNVNTFTLYINRDLGLIGFKTTGTSPSWSQWIDVKNINQLWDGNWHQITATYNGEQKIIYFDATPVTTVASTGNIESGAGYNLYLAAAKENGTVKDNYIGVLDEVRIYNYALSASEVSQLFNLVITPPDVTAPTVSSFTIPPTSASLNVAISSFSATDNKAVTAYMITESPSVPSPTDNRWVATPPTSYSFTSEGTKTLYAWAKDEAGNVSSPLSDQVTITLPVSNSPESEYLFEEAAGVTVIDSKGDNNGTIVNEEFRVSGHFGNGLEFFGNGYIDLGQSFGSNVQNQVTLSAWIKPSTSASGYQAIIRHGGPNVNTFTLYINRDLGLIGFKTTGTSPSWSQWIDVKNINQLWDGNWHQITATYDGAQKIIYLDATPITTVASTGNIESGAGYNLYLAAAKENGTIKDNYIGVLDEVRIYNYALSASEVSQLFTWTALPLKEGNITTSAFEPVASIQNLNDGINKMDIKIYPNPAESYVLIELPKSNVDKVVYELLNSNGMIVLKQKADSDITKIDLRKQSAGMYFIRTTFNNNSIAKKLIIK